MIFAPVKIFAGIAAIYAAALALVPSAGWSQVATRASSRLQFDWEHVIGADAADMDLKAEALAPDGDGVWVLVQTGSILRPAGFEIRHVNNAQVETRRVDVNAVLDGVTSFREMAVMTGNRVALTAQMASGLVLVMVDGNTGRLVGKRTIPETFASKAVSMGDRRVLLVGNASGRGWFASIDDSGQTVWQKTLPSEEVPTILSASSTRGGFVLLGNAPSSADKPVTWVGTINMDGALVTQQRLPGDYDTIAVADDGTTLLLGTRRGPGTVEPVVLLLVPDLKELRPATAIVPAVADTSAFTAAALLGREWLIAGPGKDRLPWFATVGSDGTVGWSEVRAFDPKTIPLTLRFVVASKGSSGFAAFSIAALNARGEHLVAVHVLKFRVQP